MFWMIALLVVLGSIAALAQSLRNSPLSSQEGTASDLMRAFFRDRLDWIDRDHEAGKISAGEATAARAELAREVLHKEREYSASGSGRSARVFMWSTLPAIALVALGLYVWIGRADLLSEPQASREAANQAAAMDIEAAIATVEERMEQDPGDVRGWILLAPIYIEQGRFIDAVAALRRVLALEPPTADRQTDLAEALILANDGAFDEETLRLLDNAIASDPLHVRSRFYLAGELTRMENYEDAAALWEELLAIATGEEPWVETARSGLAAAQAGRGGDMQQDDQINDTVRGMVDGLAARLDSGNGTAAGWIQLVRSRRQLDGPDAARADLERGLNALFGQDRALLEDFGREMGLVDQR